MLLGLMSTLWVNLTAPLARMISWRVGSCGDVDSKEQVVYASLREKPYIRPSEAESQNGCKTGELRARPHVCRINCHEAAGSVSSPPGLGAGCPVARTRRERPTVRSEVKNLPETMPSRVRRYFEATRGSKDRHGIQPGEDTSTPS